MNQRDGFATDARDNLIPNFGMPRKSAKSNWAAVPDDTLTVCRYKGFWYETARKNP